mmetsp:Transcript_3633/g.11194  ORF Transcript_3633/g.11194 Transcript_3633/m.11194 type:complete len:317 (+) Transcript_3633:675-1625(+)
MRRRLPSQKKGENPERLPARRDDHVVALGQRRNGRGVRRVRRRQDHRQERRAPRAGAQAYVARAGSCAQNTADERQRRRLLLLEHRGQVELVQRLQERQPAGRLVQREPRQLQPVQHERRLVRRADRARAETKAASHAETDAPPHAQGPRLQGRLQALLLLWVVRQLLRPLGTQLPLRLQQIRVRERLRRHILLQLDLLVSVGVPCSFLPSFLPSFSWVLRAPVPSILPSSQPRRDDPDDNVARVVSLLPRSSPSDRHARTLTRDSARLSCSPSLLRPLHASSSQLGCLRPILSWDFFFVPFLTKGRRRASSAPSQ